MYDSSSPGEINAGNERVRREGIMANHLSTEKAIRKTKKKAAINKNRRTRVRTYVKKVIAALDSNTAGDETNKALVTAQSEIMRAVSKGLIKKNTASRKISRLAQKVRKLV